MNAAIIAIGDELIQGYTVDSNSGWISQFISDYNINIYKTITIGDSPREIKKTLDEFILDECPIIFITGGLGPTHDDITKKSLLEYFETTYKFDKTHHENLKKKFSKRGIKFEEAQKSQSQILACSKKINNMYGSALGMYIHFSQSKIFVLPGVPREMQGMMENEIMPKFLNQLKKIENNFFTILTTGVYESKLSKLLSPFIKKHSEHIRLAFLPHYHGVDIRVFSKKNKTKSLAVYKNEIVNQISKYVYGFNDDTIGEIINGLLDRYNITLSVAESCTGGLIAKLITDTPGSSGFFLGGLVAYSNDMKKNLLNVNERKIIKYGAVSKEVSKEMCENIKEISGSVSAISTTGISGPEGGSKDKPVGLVYITVSYLDKFITRKFLLPPKRDIHRKVASHVALNMLRKLIISSK